TCREGDVLQIPVGHMDGNYFCDAATLEMLEKERRVVFRYSSPRGEITAAANPNGSLANIAGICSEERNVLGMMPHPERAGGEPGDLAAAGKVVKQAQPVGDGGIAQGRIGRQRFPLKNVQRRPGNPVLLQRFI